MPGTDDIELLQRYAKEGSEAAFATLVTRYVNLVYSAAQRKTGDPHAAEEITQAVFIILARKAGHLREKTILSGWLYQTARLTAASFLRTELRRARREQEAYMENSSNETEPSEWSQVAPLLEDAMGELGNDDRAAVVLRFFEKKSFQEVATAFGTSENAAKKRVGRALEKLRKFLAKRGVASTSAIIANGISAHSIQCAPIALAKSVTTAVTAKGVVTSGSTLTLIKGALKIMAWTKMKTAVVTGAAVILVAGTVTTTVLIRHPQSVKPTPRAAWKSAGYSKPEFAFESAIFAMSQRDIENYKASLAPEGRFFKDLLGKSDNEIFAMFEHEIGGVNDYHITETKNVSPDEVILTVEAAGQNGQAHFALQRIGGDWKLSGMVKNQRNIKAPPLQLDPNRPSR